MSADHACADRRVRTRVRKARFWMYTAWLVHGSSAVTAVLAVVSGRLDPFLAVATGVLVVGPLLMLARWERTTPSRGRPAAWLRRAAAVVVPHHAGVALAAAGLSARPVTGFAIGAGLLAMELTAVALASRALRRPMTADLGAMDVEVLAKIRSADPQVPALLSNNEVVLTATALIVTVLPDLKWKFVHAIAFTDVTEVDVRPATAGEPWFVTEDGSVQATPPGNVVRVVHRSGVRSLPVEDPSGFATVLRARVDAVRERARDREEPSNEHL